ncbi:TPA: hypothetical protein PQI25_001399 [Staphylococcus aureus]|uniref:Uncharacterized protein n=2 Tax=Staphylococcus aureus TaxID=1280 RepID=A0AAP8CPY2_STAAU|nr:hypothetical protein [Staphylococcus aureus]HDH6211732.1 hypothetical protein [Staphylococcus aureus LTCF-12-55]HDH6226164.1 hypothetical protein [Staphylococcus aureus LTCF-12-46]HDH6265214.1 hypothetical protein [Staphylococcus aureus LTCF-7-30]HDH6421320.1 hypothetical protein [Staphylococcus aureus MRSA-Lux-33]HDH6423472.1 hypothetical protein [Staphylococcus aureus MRSA-Lux-34]HDH6426154.1 hypothetical protein [Staphylococcus aureus MRSA-Lux-32]HDH6429127.1 hypothetical protein [Stap
MLTNRLTSVNYVKKRLIQNIQRILSKEVLYEEMQYFANK